MANNSTKIFETLLMCVKIITGIQGQISRQIRSKDGLSDTLIKLSSEAVKNNAYMPKVFAIESVLIPLGFLNNLAIQLADGKADHGYLRDTIISNPDMQQLSLTILQKKTENKKRYKELYDYCVPGVVNAVRDIDADKNAPKPYNAFNILDLETWLLASLIDIFDAYFGADPLNKEIAKDNEAREQIVNALVERLENISTGTEVGINKEFGKRGWYASTQIVEQLNKYSKALVRRSAKKTNEYLPEDGDIDAWNNLIEGMLVLPAVIESTLVTTRAVCALLVVGKEVFAEGGFEAEVEDDARLIRNAFANAEKEVLRSEHFLQFVFGLLEKFKSIDSIDAKDFDQFIHLTALLAFAFKGGYFLDDQDLGNVDKLNEVATNAGFPDRASVMAVIKKHLVWKSGLRSELVRTDEGAVLNKLTYFLATGDLTVLVDENTGDFIPFANPTEKEAFSPKHKFSYNLALPLIVKAMAQISLDERFRLMVSTHHEEWPDISWPEQWLFEIEESADYYAESMIENYVQQRDGNVVGICANSGEPDLSLTAAVVDALSIWVGSLALRNALEQVVGSISSPSVVAQPVDSDHAVVDQFFQLLKRRTTPDKQDTDHQRRSRVFWHILRESFIDDALITDQKAEIASEPNIFVLFVCVDLAMHIINVGEKRSLGYAEKQVCDEISILLRKEGATDKSSAGSSFPTIREAIVGKYPGAFSESRI